MPAAPLALSILNYRSAPLALSAARSALASPLGREATILIVDNLSPGDDAAHLSEGIAALPEATRPRLILSDTNGGFAAGNNLAFREIRALSPPPEAILLLNPDAELLPGALEEMLAVLRAHPKAGFVAPRLQNPDGTTWMGAFRFPSFGTEVWRGLGIGAIARHFPVVLPDSDVPVQADWLTGSALLIRWEAFAALGDMDEGYFLYYEETDYMWRGRELGWECWHAPKALVLHHEGASTGIVGSRVRSGRQPSYWFDSWARFFAKNYGPGYARATAAGKLLAMMIAALHHRLRGKPYPLPERFFRDFAAQVLFRRLSPPPASPLAGKSRRREG